MNAVSVIFAPMLALSAIFASLLAGHARAAARDYLRFSAVLYLALAASIEIEIVVPGVSAVIFAAAVTQVVAATASVTLALALCAAFERLPSRSITSVLLVLSCIVGIASAVMGISAIAYALLIASACFMAALSLRRWHRDRQAAAHAFLSICALVCGAAAAQIKDSEAALTLFWSASVLGFALALTRSRGAIAENRNFRARRFAISRKR